MSDTNRLQRREQRVPLLALSSSALYFLVLRLELGNVYACLMLQGERVKRTAGRASSGTQQRFLP
jgi:hypothetical protein